MQLLQEILSNYQTELLKSPANVIQVCGEILSNYSGSSTVATTTPSILTLNQIVRHPADEDEGDEFLEMALNLLSTVTAESIQREIAQDEISAYETCLNPLKSISTRNKSKSHRNQAKSVLSLINARIAMTVPSTEIQQQSDEDIYRQAVEYISDPIVPIRAQGLSILRDLILRRSCAVDVDTVLDLLIGLLHDDDSYVYLNAIKTIQVLAEIHGEQITRKILTDYESHGDVDERVRLAEAVAGVIRRMGELFTGDFAQEVISRCVNLVSTEKDWRIRVSAVGLVSVCCELAPQAANSAIEMALHLFRVNDLSFTDGEGAAPLRRGAVAVIAGVLRGGGIDALGLHTRDVIRSIKYLARSDGDDTVKSLAQGILEMLGGVVDTVPVDTRWNIGKKIQEL